MIRQVVFVLGLAACQPMYGAKPDRLRSPEPLKPKVAAKDPKVEPPPPPAYVDKCKLPMSAKLEQRDHRGAEQKLTEGQVRFDEAEKQPADSTERAVAAKASLEKFRDAITQDHFHAEATLMLARAYDVFHRKGCALAMLQRIGAMRANKAFQREADRIARDVQRNADQWFAAYSTEARDAVQP